jgi:uncharacterized protein
VTSVGNGLNELPVLAVVGEVVLEVEPDIARIGLTITAKDPDRTKTLRLLNRRAGAVDELLGRFGDAIEEIETAGIRISPQLKSTKPSERITGYVGVVHQTITVQAFDRLGELIAQLADQEVIEVAGPWWSLRPNSPVYRRARGAAVHDAVRRARDYAEAIGSDLIELLELADDGLLSRRPGQADSGFMPAAAGSVRALRSAPDEFTFDIAPVKQIVRASVEARFRISAPALAAVDSELLPS